MSDSTPCTRCGKPSGFDCDSADWLLCPACGTEADAAGVPYDKRGEWAKQGLPEPPEPTDEDEDDELARDMILEEQERSDFAHDNDLSDWECETPLGHEYDDGFDDGF